LEIEKIASDVSKNVFKIFIIHQPEGPAIKIAERNNYNLLLAGHTHGGQITFLFPFKNISPTMLETKYVKGVFHLNKMTMIVTSGLGMSLLPIRYNSTPEITIINLRKK
jgi:predicted MPP superfamily phosphohydrolase